MNENDKYECGGIVSFDFLKEILSEYKMGHDDVLPWDSLELVKKYEPKTCIWKL